MGLKGWQVLGGVTVVIVIYVALSQVFGTGSSSGLAIVIAAVFGTFGLLLGRRIANRLQEGGPD